MQVLLDEYSLGLFEAIRNPASVGAMKTIELDEDEIREAEEFMNEIMEKENEKEDSLDDIQIEFCDNMRNGKCMNGDNCTKFHPVEEMDDDDPENE